MRPTFLFESRLWNKYPIVIGVDEVGRGALAGPLVAGAVSFRFKSYDLGFKNIIINDSKKMTPSQREKSAKWIRDNCICGISESSVYEINKYGIVKATHKAFRKAIQNLILKTKIKTKIFVLADAFYTPYLKNVGIRNQKAVIKGDEKSFSIAAASIIAKVYRDSLMRELAAYYKKYGWDSNKGYGTRVHINAIKKFGVCKHHRLAFISHIAYNEISYDKTERHNKKTYRGIYWKCKEWKNRRFWEGV